MTRLALTARWLAFVLAPLAVLSLPIVAVWPR